MFIDFSDSVLMIARLASHLLACAFTKSEPSKIPSSKS
jgi:hypothetical protein